MNNQLILFDCINGMIFALQQKKAGVITDEEFALAQEGFKELALLAKHDALQFKTEGPAVLKTVDTYLLQKFPALAKKLLKGRSLHERFLLSARLYLCTSLIDLIGVLIQIIKDFSLKMETSIVTELAVELEILKKIYSFFQKLLENATAKEQTKLFFDIEASQQAEHLKMENLLYHALKAIVKCLDAWANSHGLPHAIQEYKKKLAHYAHSDQEDNNQHISHLLQPSLALKDTYNAIEKIALIIQPSVDSEVNAEPFDPIEQSSLWFQQQSHHWNHYCFHLLS